ncbi:MAG TPA: tetratricopeptide repeat protein [Marinobacter sp.]|uniref:tetratricopeptide repeat protein n=1 Tax=Marinobacter sp. TaxID=50741 RepID=UPI002D7E77FB|nr:tetratricopeptide repeat protein [Marinobacter sp.]HET8799981.1 tetratricopeptide repeat protein [Marinobacter sp.]
MLRCLFTLCLLTVTLMRPVMASEHTADATRHFRAGIAAFQANQPEKAVTLLEAAAAKGMTSRALTYNLGVAYFQTGAYRNAERMFRQLLDTRQKVLAQYNLGLVALAQNETGQAANWFREVAQSNGDEKLLRLARARLRELSPDDARTYWQALVSLSAGHEENIGLFPDGAASTLDGGFLESANAVTGYPYQRGQGALKVSARLYARHYLSEEAFDSEIVQLDSAWVHKSPPYRISAGVGGDQYWQGGKAREHRGRLFAEVTSRTCAIAGEQARCTLAARAEQVEASRRYQAYNGQHYQLDAGYRTAMGRWRGHVHYRVDYDDRENLNTGDEYFSVSPLGQTLGVRGDYRITETWSLGVAVRYRYNFYRTAHQLRVPEGTLIIRREDQRLTLSVHGDYRINNTFSLLATWRHAGNDSNLPRYRYNRQTVTLGVSAHL